jgi:hypothetical protein
MNMNKTEVSTTQRVEPDQWLRGLTYQLVTGNPLNETEKYTLLMILESHGLYGEEVALDVYQEIASFFRQDKPLTPQLRAFLIWVVWQEQRAFHGI